MFPTLNLDEVVEEIEQEENKVYDKTFLFDFEKGDFVIRDGRLVEVSGKEATKVRLEKLLRTDKFKYGIYKKLDDEEKEVEINIPDFVEGETGLLKETSISKAKTQPARLYTVSSLLKFFIESELKREIEENAKRYIQEIDRIEDFRVEHESFTLKIFLTLILRDNETFNQEVIL
mgnify:CR=1 FL=1